MLDITMNKEYLTINDIDFVYDKKAGLSFFNHSSGKCLKVTGGAVL